MEKQEFERQNLLMTSVEAGDLEGVKKMLQEGMDINLLDSSEDTLLMRASKNGDEKMASLLLQAGSDVNFQNKQGQTALMRAVQFEKIEMIKYLILKGARLDLKDNNGQTALNMAIESSNKGIFDLLIDIDLIKKGLATAPIEGLKISSQKVEEKDSYGRDYTF